MIPTEDNANGLIATQAGLFGPEKQRLHPVMQSRLRALVYLHSLEVTMNRILASTATLAVVSALTVGMAADKGLKSGLQVGDSAGPYNSKDITGPAKGRSLCYR